MPTIAFTIFIAAAVLIVAAFGWVARSTRQHREVDYASANRLRLVFFLSVAAILVTFLVLTLPHLPYPVEAGRPTASSKRSASSTRGR